MPESIITPATAGGASLLAVAVSIIGPIFGPYVVIVFSALAGALWPLSAAKTATRADGAWLLIRCSLTAVVLTSLIASIVSGMYETPVDDLVGPVALGIGAMGNGWQPVFGALSEAVAAIAAKFGGGKNGQ